MTNRIVRTAFFFALAAASLRAEAPFTIVVADLPRTGFNDPTPAEPVGGNPGKTLGEQRLIALQHAAGIWSRKLDSPVPIRVSAKFEYLPCSAQSGTLASAGPLEQWSFDRVNREFFADTWYPSALANVIAGELLDPDTEEIEIFVNPNVGRANCIRGKTWYYGLDGRAPEGTFDLVTVTLHELAHGLGFTGLTDDLTEEPDFGDIYARYIVDTASGKPLSELPGPESIAALSRFRGAVWDGANVRRAAGNILPPGFPTLRISEPAAIAGIYEIVSADFGGRFAAAGIGGLVVAAQDAADPDGPTTTDACSPLVNASQVAGRIALADRGTCSFVDKARNAQAAGAIALIVANHVDATAAMMTGDDPAITIPVSMVNRKDGSAIREVLRNFGQVSVQLFADATRKRGTGPGDRPLLFTPSPFDAGSSLFHWDPSLWPNQLMEPNISSDLRHEVDPPADLTVPLLMDIGWLADFDGVPGGRDECPGSDRGVTIKIQGCDTGVVNTTAPNGCRLSDSYKACPAGGGFVGCVDSVSSGLVRAGRLKADEPASIRACALKVQLP